MQSKVSIDTGECQRAFLGMQFIEESFDVNGVVFQIDVLLRFTYTESVYVGYNFYTLRFEKTVFSDGGTKNRLSFQVLYLKLRRLNDT